jgi:ubiquinol-cytochrome c reductase cytochrome b subunit
MISRVINWFTYRWPFKPIIKWSLEEEIPGGDSFWYSFGATLLFVFVIQVVTGIWQLFYYVPTTDHAYQSVSYLRYQVPFGWLIHGLHYWGSNAFIIIVFIHLLRVFIWGAYKEPRQLTWLVGVILLFLVLALSFTGALLPWDELGYWAAEVGTSIAGTIPLIGFFIKEFMRGGAAMSQMTLSRFFIAHVAILPGILAALIAFHVVAFRRFRSVGPWNEEKLKKTGFFWPQQVFKDLIIMSLLFVIMVGLSAFWRAQVSGPADELDNIITPKPEWQFLFLYQFLKLFKGKWEPVGTTGVPLVLFLILFFLPFYDRNKKRSPLHRPLAMLGCFALVTWFFVYTILGYYSKPGASLIAKVSVSSQASASVKAGADLFSSQGCIACHTVHGQGGNIGPNLSSIGSQGLSNQWINTQIRDPKSHDPSTAMPAFKSLTDQQVKNLVDFLQSLGGSSSSGQSSSQSSSSSQPPQKVQAKSTGEPNTAPAAKPSGPNRPSASSQSQSASQINQGQSLFSSQGCIGCHTVNGEGGSVGPNLSNIGSKGLSKQWLMVQLKNPKKHDPSTVMPSFSSMSDSDINAITNYLESLKGSSGQSSSQSSSQAKQSSTSSQTSGSSRKSQSSNEPSSTSSKTSESNNSSGSSQSQKTSLISHGKSLFNSKGCINCHTIDGKGGSVGPDLSDVGSKGLSKQWLTVQLKDPKKHDPSTIMPSFSPMSDSDINALTAYLENLKSSSKQTSSSQSSTQAEKSSTPPQSSTTSPQPKTPTEPNAASVESMPTGKAAYLVGNPPHGKKLFKKNCSRCHGEDGKGGVSNPGSLDGTVPPLNPIDREIFSGNPEIFAENIDRYIQHGSKPEGPNPQKTMPAFGDGLKLTQQMIAEIEAYILKLNGVDRAAVIYPGVAPVAFFGMTLGGYAIAVFIILMLGTKLDKSGSYTGQTNTSDATGHETESSGSRTPSPDEQTQIQSEENQTGKYELNQRKKSDESETSSVSFAIVVIIVIAVIATAVMLIFSSFVTTKPIPSITTRHITSLQENQSGTTGTNAGQTTDNQQSDNED